MKINEIISLLENASMTLFAEEARLCDENNTFPYKNFEFLKQHNFQALLVPQDFGGFGLNFQEYQQCLQIIAQGCGSTASAFNMHSSIIGGLAEVYYNTKEQNNLPQIKEFLEYFFNLVVEGQKIFASVSSEPGRGARISQTQSTYEKIDQGFIYNGEKSFVTMAEYADYYVTLANKKSDDDNLSNTSYLTYFIIDRLSEGVKIIPSWDTLGMRATQSHRVKFENVIVPKQNVFFGTIGFALEKMTSSPHWIIGGYLGVYLGIMKAALDFTVEYIRSRTNPDTEQGLGYEKLILSRLSKMYMLYQHAKLAVDSACQLVLENNRSDETKRSLYFAKHTVGEFGMELTSLAIKTCGGSTISKHFPLERYFRDSRCCALMPTVSDLCELYIGRDILGLSSSDIW